MPEKVTFTPEQQELVNQLLREQQKVNAFTENVKTFLHMSITRATNDRKEIYDAGIVLLNNADFIVACLIQKPPSNPNPKPDPASEPDPNPDPDNQ